MKNGKPIAFVLLLLLSTGVLAEGGKQRGDVGQGSIVQGQIRVVEPPAQWTSTSTQPGSVQVESDTAEAAEIAEEADTLF